MSMERKCQLSENMGNNIELDLISVEKHLIQIPFQNEKDIFILKRIEHIT